MSYQVLARKYRPQTFAELVGQDHVVQTLSNAIATGRVAHAFLFVGPRGIGKTSTARILAKALNAPGGPRIDFDPNEDTCREIAEGRSMDVIEIDGASNNNVDQIRELRDNVQYMPSRGNFKIYIIDEVHMLTTAAFNALLKTLEEPPAHVKFIFATTEPHKVLATILSRCQRFDLKRISDHDIAKQLSLIAQQEGIEVEPAALKIIARNAEGGMRDAESAFDQLISFCGNRITEADVLEVFGLTGHQEIWDLAEAIQAGQADLALGQIRRLIDRGKDLGRLTQELLRYFRNLLLFIISSDMAANELDETEMRHYEAMEPLPSRAAILAIIDELIQLEEKIRFALVKEVLFEIAVIRMTQQREKVALEEIIQALATGQPVEPKQPVAGRSTAPAEPRTPSAAPATSAAPPPAREMENPRPTVIPEAPASHPVAAENSAPQITDPAAQWETVCASARERDLTLRRALLETRFISFRDGLLSIEIIATRDAYQSLVNSKSHETLEREIKREFGAETRMKLSLHEREEAPPPTETPQPQPVSPPATATAPPSTPKRSAPAQTSNRPIPDASEFANDPLIQQALKEFDAQIIEIRARP